MTARAASEYVERDVMLADVGLEGRLTAPAGAEALVLFVHGSGSGRASPRNTFVSDVLSRAGLATLLVDLLTGAEQAADARSGRLRFDIGLLTERVLAVVDWLERERDPYGLAVGLFGASTGAAAALNAAAARPHRVRAVVSRGGRPDLAADVLGRVRAPTLLIVGSEDHPVSELNERALAALGGAGRMEVVAGATHLFEEPGALEQVADLARDWFLRHLVGNETGRRGWEPNGAQDADWRAPPGSWGEAPSPGSAWEQSRLPDPPGNGGSATEPFADRRDAGRKLGERLRGYAGQADVVVFGLARGGVPVAVEVAEALGAPLDVFLVRKLGAPGQEELALGAVASGDVAVLNEPVVSALGLSDAEIAAVEEREREELARRERAYRDDRPPLEVAERTAIVVDDGLATGASMRAAVRALRRRGAARIVVGVPVAAPQTCADLEHEVDEIVCVHTPRRLLSVGAWYAEFRQISDDEVRELLATSPR